MDLKLNIRNDTLIPSQAFKDWAEKVLTEEGIRTSGKNFFTKLGNRSAALQERLAELKQKIDACPAGSDVWFSRMFLWPFGGTVTADAKEYFEELEKDGQIKKLEDAADAAAAKRQENGRKLYAECAHALTFFDGDSSLLAAVGELSVALTTTAPPEAAPITSETIYQSIIKMSAPNYALLRTAIIPPPVSGVTAPPQLQPTAATLPAEKSNFLKVLKDAVNDTNKTAALTPLLTALDPSVTVDAAKTALATITENRMFSSLDILLESGKITQEDYNRLSSRLLRTSSIINEQATPAELAKRKAEFDGFASSIKVTGQAIIAELKGLQSLGQRLSTVNESIHRKVMKAHIKKRLLQETASRDSREQLNEFFLFAALLAALTGALAWAASKVAEFFKGSEYGRGPATYSPRTPADQVDNGLQTLGASINAGYGPDGVLVGPDGKKVAGAVENKEATKVRMEDCRKNIISAMTLCGTIEAAATAAVLSPPTLGAAAALAPYLGVTDAAKITAASAALVKLQLYKNADTIKTPIDNVITALTAV